MDELCADFPSEELSFEAWRNCHARLDLSIPVCVPVPIAAQGGDVDVCYSRTVRDAAESRPMREKVQLSVKIPAGTRDGAKIRVTGHGDRVGDCAGDLELMIRVKAEAV